MPKMALGPGAEKDLKKLSKSGQRAAYKALKKLQENPRHNSLRTEKHKTTGHFKSRASDSLRILWYYEGDKIVVIRIGWHEIID